MIVTQAGYANSEESGSEEWKIKRLKWEKTHADQSSLQQLNIARFHGDRKPKTREKICHENCSITSSPCSSFSQQGRWRRLWFFFFERVSGDEIIQEYSGFNVKWAREAGKLPEPKTKLMYTPFLDMLPSEPDTMKTAMLEAKKNWHCWLDNSGLFLPPISRCTKLFWVSSDRIQMHSPILCHKWEECICWVLPSGI